MGEAEGLGSAFRRVGVWAFGSVLGSPFYADTPLRRYESPAFSLWPIAIKLSSQKMIIRPYAPPLTVTGYKNLPETGPRYLLIEGDLYRVPRILW